MKRKKMFAPLIVCGLVLSSQVSFAGPVGKADLTIQSVSINPYKPTTDDTIKFTVKMINGGSVSSAPSKLAIRVGGESTPAIYNAGRLNPGGIMSFYREVKLNVAQNYRVTAYADYKNDVAESSENNNIVYRNFRVTKNLPDLVLSITCGKVFHLGQKRSVVVYVKNIGSKISNPCKLDIYASKKGTKSYSVPALQPGQIYSATRKVKWRLGKYNPGNKKIWAHIDRANVVREINENNNYVETKYKVGLPGAAMGGIGCPCNGIVRSSTQYPAGLCYSYSRNDELTVEPHIGIVK